MLLFLFFWLTASKVLWCVHVCSCEKQLLLRGFELFAACTFDLSWSNEPGAAVVQSTENKKTHQLSSGFHCQRQQMPDTANSSDLKIYICRMTSVVNMLHHRQSSINIDPEIFNITPCILLQRFPSWASCSSKAHPERVRTKHQSRQTTPIYVECRCYTSNRLSWLEQGYFPVHSDVNISWQTVSCIPHNQHFHSWFQTFAGKISLSSTTTKITGKCNLLVHYGYRQLITEYLISLVILMGWKTTV